MWMIEGSSPLLLPPRVSSSPSHFFLDPERCWFRDIPRRFLAFKGKHYWAVIQDASLNGLRNTPEFKGGNVKVLLFLSLPLSWWNIDWAEILLAHDLPWPSLAGYLTPSPPKKPKISPSNHSRPEQMSRESDFPEWAGQSELMKTSFIIYNRATVQRECVWISVHNHFHPFLHQDPSLQKKKQKNSRLFFYYKRSAIRQLCFYLQVLENCTGMRVSRSATRVLKLLHWTENKITNYNHCNYEKFTPVQKERKNNLIFLLLVPLFTLLLSVHLSSLESACYNYQRPIRKQLHRKLSFRFLLLELPFKIKAVQNSNGIKHL